MRRRTLPILLVLAVFTPQGAAHADTDLVGGMELGALSSSTQAGRRDMAGLGSILLGAEWRRGNWSYAVQAGLPMLPGLTAQLPLTARRWIGDYFYLVGAARPLFTLVGQCENDANRCPRKQRLDAEQRGHSMMVGGFGSLGLGVGDQGRRWSLRFEASYIVGYAVGLERKVDVETAQSGLYQGGVASLGARF